MKAECKSPIAPTGILHPIRTLLVDDSAVHLLFVRDLLDTQGLVQVVGTATNGSEALNQAGLLAPDLVLMDLQMPCMDGLEATSLLRRQRPDTRIIIMTSAETTTARAAANAHGAHGFVAKDRIHDDLMAEISRVFRLTAAGSEQGAA